MNLKTNFPKPLQTSFTQELNAYSHAFNIGDLLVAWRHLERAQLIGQAYPLAHTQVHWLMLKFGLSIKSKREILGQIRRLLVGGVKSFVVVIPIGNTDGAIIPLLRPMKISSDLQKILNQK